MNEIPKVVFSKRLQHADRPETRIARGDLSEEIGRLKREPGNDLIAYGSRADARELAELLAHRRARLEPRRCGRRCSRPSGTVRRSCPGFLVVQPGQGIGRPKR